MVKLNTQLSFSESGADDDVDNEDNQSEPTSTMERNAALSSEEERDEVKEIREASKKDTSRIRMTRIIMSAALLLTSLAVTLTTYEFLKREEENKFETAFNQFSKTVGEATKINHQNRLEAYSSLADILSSVAHVNNETWPFFTFPRFEHFGYNAIKQSRTEIVNIVHRVTKEQQPEWIQYANENYDKWLTEGYEIESKKKGDIVYENLRMGNYHPFISKKGQGANLDADFVPQDEKDEYWASWAYSPPPVTDGFINWDFTSDPVYEDIIKAAISLKNETLFTAVKTYVSAGIAFTEEEHDAMHSDKLASVKDDLPHAFLFHPIHENPDDMESEVVAVICSGIAWDNSLLNLLPEEIRGLYVVIQNSCGQKFTFLLNGPDATFLGSDDLHDTRFDHMVKTFYFHPEEAVSAYESTEGHCIYYMHIYPSDEFRDIWDDNTSVIFAIVIATTFMIVILVFFVYDLLVQMRNEKLVERAARTSAIVTSLFPGQFREEMIATSKLPQDQKHNSNGFTKNAAMEGGPEDEKEQSLPLAKCYTDVTVMFADIVGFTSWSTKKDPRQVFELLETLYNAFDEIAKSRRIFKVETVGDCYVAACGIPTPNPHHAVAMCRFARNIRSSMQILTRELTETLGPDTADLDLRIGIHSGPVTAGVIRGQKARFQLFGDTMNTASRIETNGAAGKIHLSAETAELLKGCGKEKWAVIREDLVIAKGKGELQTYWLTSDSGLSSTSRSSRSGTSDESSVADPNELPVVADATHRSPKVSSELVDWSVDVIVHLLQKVQAIRSKEPKAQYMTLAENARIHQLERALLSGDFLDEYQSMLHIPHPDDSSTPKVDSKLPALPTDAIDQLRMYMTCVANMHRDTDRFHTFEHAVHVAQSVRKLMSLWEEPWAPLACVWAALVHHIDHPGHGAVENTSLAAAYGHRAVAEQNALQLSWKLLLDSKFVNLRRVLYTNLKELEYFRAVSVNAILATDLNDKTLEKARDDRWQRITGPNKSINEIQAHDLEATAVLEVIMQASNVAHTMQNWSMYRQWNTRLFEECYLAYLDGRIRNDPSEQFYLSELDFFDKHIMPLCKKLQLALKYLGKDASTGEERLVCALKNREDWRDQGKKVVADLVEKLKSNQ